MSLIVHLPPKASKSKQHTLQLPRFGNDVDVEAFLVRDPCLIQSGRRFHVFSGTLRASKTQTSPPIRVVCKLTYSSAGRDRLLRESVIYDHLKSLQGKVVPRCYGYFEYTNIAGCLVLEHAGEALTTCFENLDDELKLKVMDAFDQIHQAGVQHDDIAERNVLLNEEGRVFVIDFEHSFPSKCKRRVPIPGLGDLGIERSKLLCNELWDLGWSLRMWKPPVVQVFGHLTPIQAFNDHERLIAERPPNYSQGRAETEAHYLWTEYVKRWFPDEYAKIPKDGQRHWPIVKFNREAEEDDDEEDDDDDDEDLEVITSSEQRSDPLLGSGSDYSSNGSQ